MKWHTDCWSICHTYTGVWINLQRFRNVQHHQQRQYCNGRTAGNTDTRLWAKPRIHSARTSFQQSRLLSESDPPSWAGHVQPIQECGPNHLPQRRPVPHPAKQSNRMMGSAVNVTMEFGDKKGGAVRINQRRVRCFDGIRELTECVGKAKVDWLSE